MKQSSRDSPYSYRTETFSSSLVADVFVPNLGFNHEVTYPRHLYPGMVSFSKFRSDMFGHKVASLISGLTGY